MRIGDNNMDQKEVKELFITKIDYEEKEVFIFINPTDGYRFYYKNEQDQLEVVEKSVSDKLACLFLEKDICEKYNPIKKRITYLAISIVASLSANQTTYANPGYEKAIEKTVDSMDLNQELNDDAVKEIVKDVVSDNLMNEQQYVKQIIREYHLESISEIISENQSQFLKYYEAMENNSNILPFAKEHHLLNFDYLMKHINPNEFEHQVYRISYLEEKIEREKCEKENIGGYYRTGNNEKPDFIGLASENGHTVLHEDTHRLFENSFRYLKFKNDFSYISFEEAKKMNSKSSYYFVSMSFLNEAIAEDLSSEKTREFQNSYDVLVNVLQSFYFLWGREEFLSHLKDGEGFGDYFYDCLSKSGLSIEESFQFINQMQVLRNSFSNEYKNLNKNDFAQAYYDVSATIIKMYENIYQQKWTDSPEMEIIVGSILYSYNVDSKLYKTVEHTIVEEEMAPDLKEFINNRIFSKKYLNEKNPENVLIKYDSILSPDSLSVLIKDEDNNIYTSIYRYRKPLRQATGTKYDIFNENSYPEGITTEKDYKIISNNLSFYRYVINAISDFSFLTDEEVKFYQKEAIKIHENYAYEFGRFLMDFEPYFLSIFPLISSKEQLNQFIDDKLSIYQLVDEQEYNFLINQKSIEQSKMSYYFIRLDCWKSYRDTINSMSFLSEEEKAILFQNYPRHFDNRLSSCENTEATRLDFVVDLSSCNSFSEILTLSNIHKKEEKVHQK